MMEPQLITLAAPPSELHLLAQALPGHSSLHHNNQEEMKTHKEGTMQEDLTFMTFRCKYSNDLPFVSVTGSCTALTGYRETELAHRTLLDLILPAYRTSAHQERQSAFAHHKSAVLAYVLERSDGQQKEVMEFSQTTGDDEIAGILVEVSLPTPFHSREYLQNRMQANRNERRALLLVNLRMIHLHTITYGFEHSQELLRAVKHILKTSCPLVSSISENLFAIYLESFADHAELIHFAILLNSKLKPLLAEEGVNWGIGILELKEDEPVVVDKVFRNALAASEHALGIRTHFSLLTPEMAKQLQTEELITTELSRLANGMDTDHLQVVYQPIMNMETNTIDEFEVLARLTNPQLGMVPPSQFIPLAEKTKYIIALGKLIFAHAFTFLQELRDRGQSPIRVSVNVSVIQLLEADFLADLLSMIETYQIDAACVCLEITESSLVSNYQKLNTLFSHIQKHGIHLALDDFGTGYSSFARVRTLHVDTLKIDKLFIDRLCFLAEEEAITGDIISMGHRLGYTIIAEGVEEERQRAYLIRHGCDKIQGYLISKPIPSRDALILLDTLSTPMQAHPAQQV